MSAVGAATDDGDFFGSPAGSPDGGAPPPGVGSPVVDGRLSGGAQGRALQRAAITEGLRHSGGDADDDEDGDGVPDMLEDSEETMRLQEAWKVGQHGVVVAHPEKLLAVFEDYPHLEWTDDLIRCCGVVGQVTQVYADKTLSVALRIGVHLSERVLPVTAIRKVQIVTNFFKPAMTSAQDLGLTLRQTPYGGLQMECPLDGTRAAEAGLNEYFGQWLTHVADTPVMTHEQFEAAEGNELRLEKRVTLPYEFAYQKLEQKVSSANLMSDLRVYIAFVMVFVAFFLLDRDVEPAFYITNNMLEPVLGNEIPELYTDDSGIGCESGEDVGIESVKWEKTFWDLANQGDWHAWIATMVLDSLWATPFFPTPQNSEGYAQFGPAMSGNIPLGAVRFRTIRMRNDSCTPNKDIIKRIPELADLQKCYGAYAGPQDEYEAKGGYGETVEYAENFYSKENKLNVRPTWPLPENVYNPVTMTTWRVCADMNPGARWNPPWTTGQVSLYHCGGYYFEIPWYIWNNESQEMEQTEFDWAVDRFRDRVCDDFFDDVSTRLTALEFFEYSPTYDIFLSVRMMYEVTSGGAWIPHTQLRTFEMWSAKGRRKLQTGFDCFFLSFILYYCGDFIGDARRKYRRTGSVLRHFLEAWTILEFLNLSLYLASFGFRFTWLARSMQVGLKIEDMQKLGYYPSELDELEWLYMYQIYINSCNVILTFLKLLKYMRLNKRFGIMTETLSDCQDSIIGVLVIFILVVLAYAVTGNTLFGAQMYEFRSLSASFSTLMRMLMGEFDYEAMKREQKVLAGLFFWTFLVLGLFVLLNFLIGVIAESFGKVSDNVPTMPLDRAFKKTQDDLKVLCKPRVIKNWFYMRLIKCHTRESLLETCMDAVECWRNECYEQVEDEDTNEWRYKEGEEEECQIMNRQEFMGAIRACGDPPGEVLRCLGEDYVSYIWNHLVYEFHRGQEVENLQTQMRKQGAFQKGCKNALQDKLRTIEQFTVRMEALKVSLEHMKKLLVEKGATM